MPTTGLTKLAGPAKGYIVGAHMHALESGVLPEEMMRRSFGVHGVPAVVHADRGTSMTSKSVATLLHDLRVTRSHSRPDVSTDSPYSESLPKTTKYLPTFPARFGDLEAAGVFMDAFVHADKHEHHDTGIGWRTPADVHYGHATLRPRHVRRR